jgi:hypothetical protein
MNNTHPIFANILHQCQAERLGKTMTREMYAEQYAKQVEEAWRFGVLGSHGGKVHVNRRLFEELDGDLTVCPHEHNDKYIESHKWINGIDYFCLIEVDA